MNDIKSLIIIQYISTEIKNTTSNTHTPLGLLVYLLSQ